MSMVTENIEAAAKTHADFGVREWDEQSMASYETRARLSTEFRAMLLSHGVDLGKHTVLRTLYYEVMSASETFGAALAFRAMAKGGK